jgi:hypothetical protein
MRSAPSWAWILRPSAVAMVKAHLADAILTTDYETTAWLRFTQPSVKVVQANEPQRCEGAATAPAALLNGRLIYLAEFRREQHHLVAQSFVYTGFPPSFRPVQPLDDLSGWAPQKFPAGPHALAKRQRKSRAERGFLKDRERTPEAGCRRGWGRSGSDVRSPQIMSGRKKRSGPL